MRAVPALALQLDTALRAFEVSTENLSRHMGKAARRRIRDGYLDIRVLAGRLVLQVAAASAEPDASPDASREALIALLGIVRRTGALPWLDVVEIVNSLAEQIPPPRR